MPGLGMLAQIMLAQREAAPLNGSDALLRLFSHHHKGRAQHFMPRHDPVQRLAQGAAIERTPQDNAIRHVIRFTQLLHLFYKPQTLLRIGEWRFFFMRHTGNRQRLARAFHASSKIAERRPQEQCVHPDFHTQLLPQLTDHAHCQKRVPSQFEEVVLAAYVIDLQRLGPDSRHCVFQLSLRRFIGARRIRIQLRRRQRFAVQLAVRRQRHLVQPDIRERRHVLRQSFREPVAKFRGQFVD